MRSPDDALREQWQRCRALVLDCDGVIFDANRFKEAALADIMAPYPPALREAALAHWRANGGVSRHRKFAHIFSEIVRSEDPTRDAEAAVERFGELSRAGYETVRPLAPALRLIEATGPERVHVVSGTLEEELRGVFDRQGLTPLVASVRGSPKTKQEHVRALFDERGIEPADALFIGDGAADFRTSHALGVPFVFLAELSEWPDARATLEPHAEIVWAESWRELDAALGIRGSRA